MTWRIVLTGDGSELQILAKSLVGSDLSVAQNTTRYELQSTEIDEARTPVAALAKAEELLDVVRGCMHVILGREADFRATGECIDAAGLHHHVMQVEAGTLVVRGYPASVSITRPDGTHTWSHPGDPMRQWIPVARTSATVRRVLRLLRRGTDPVNLYRVFEIIQADVGGKVTELVKSSDATRFTRSVNSSVFGDESRHGVHTTSPPPRPMSQAQASHFIRTLVKRWLDRRSIGQEK